MGLLQSVVGLLQSVEEPPKAVVNSEERVVSEARTPDDAPTDRRRKIMSTKSNRINLVGQKSTMFSAAPLEDTLDEEIEIAHDTSLLTISCSGERTQLPHSTVDNFFVHVCLKAAPAIVDPDPAISSRASADCVCIIDISRTISSDKKDIIYKSLAYIRAQLSSTDRLTVVAFDCGATVVHGLLKMSPENKALSQNAVHSFIDSHMIPEKPKDIFTGLSLAAYVLSCRSSANSICPLFMFTDGYDYDPPSGSAYLEVCRTIRSAGATLAIFALALCPRIDHLREVAAAAEGNVTQLSAEHPEAAVAGVLGAVLYTVARSINVQVRVSDGCKFLQGSCGKYRLVVAEDRQQIVVQYANIYADEHRDILMKIQVPAVDRDIPAFEVIQASCRYVNLVGIIAYAEPVAMPEFAGALLESEIEDIRDANSKSSNSITADAVVEGPKAACMVARVAVPAPMDQINYLIDKQQIRSMILPVLERVRTWADGQNFEMAYEEIDTPIAWTKKTASYRAGLQNIIQLLHTMEQIKASLVSEEVYNATNGKDLLCESIYSISSQRAFLRTNSSTEALYQIPTSVRAQADVLESYKL